MNYDKLYERYMFGTDEPVTEPKGESLESLESFFVPDLEDMQPETETKPEAAKNSRPASALDRFHKFRNGKNGDKYPYEVNDNAIVTDIIKNKNLFTNYGVPYWYEESDGCYYPDEALTRTRQVIEGYVFPDLITEPRISRVMKLLLSKHELVRSDSEINLYPKDWILFRNGFLNVRNMEMYPKSPSYYAVCMIPHEWEYNVNIDDSVFRKWFESMIDDPDDRRMTLEYFGYMLTISTEEQKYLVVTGSGGLGKSEMLTLVRKAIGEQITCTIGLQQLSGRFYSHFLHHKLCDIFSDLPSTEITDSGMLKMLTGGDTIPAERKLGQVYQFEPYSKLLFSCNAVPKIRDERSDAIYRRMMILRIEHRGINIPDLKSKLEEDIQSFLYMAVKAYHDALITAGKITPSARSIDEVEQLRRDTDSIAAFLDERMYTSFDQKQFISRKRLYGLYADYCDEYGRMALSQQRLYEELRYRGFKEKKIEGDRYFCGLMPLNEYKS